MAAYFCGSGGSDANNGTTWALRKATFAGAIAAMTANGDMIIVDAAAPPADIAATTTWTFTFHCSVIASTNSGTSTITPTTMGASAYLGSAGATTYGITLAGAFKVYFYGITLRNAGGTNVSITLSNTDGAHYEFDNCYFWLGTTNGSSSISIGGGGANSNSYTLLKNCTLRFGATGQFLAARQHVEIIGGSVSSSGSAPNTLVGSADRAARLSFFGSDLTHVTGTLVGSISNATQAITFSQCRFATTLSAVMAVQTPANKSSAQVWVFDCNAATADTHGLFGYYDAFGSVTTNTGIYLTATDAKVTNSSNALVESSWEVVTTANCGFGTPFVTPWISLYNTATSAITPRLEILRNGSTTAYTDAEVWGEFSVKDNSGFTNSDTFNDRQALVDWAAGTAGASQATGVGTGSWTGGTTPWSGKVDSGSAITPAEAGHIRARVVVGAPSITLYVDPQIRT